MLLSSTIAAISTPPGKGGVAIIRVSGPDALAIGKQIFTPKGNLPIEKRAPRTQIYGDIIKENEKIDDGMLTYFPAPGSYTGEDTVEISCHGGMLISSLVLEAALLAGAVSAGRGEFTRRAFTNGKLSLTETEAIAMLLDAESEAQVKLSRKTSRDALSQRIDAIRSSLTSLLSSIYARIDYPDEDLGDFTDEECAEELRLIIERISALISTYKTGRAISEGIKTAIVGKPNVGKSSLYNLLVGEDAAIVTDIPGTTRDVLERSIALGDVLLRLYDTAGIRSSGTDTVEAIGIDRSIKKAEEAELILMLIDISVGIDKEDIAILDMIKGTSGAKLAILTKTDLLDSEIEPRDAKLRLTDALRSYGFEDVISISSKVGADEAYGELSGAVGRLFVDEKISVGDDAIISSARQHSALLRAKDYAKCALEAITSGLPQDAASSDIELSLGAIAELDGRAVSEDVVADIFSKFCVGK